jgi:hypothetical protein
LIGIKEEEKLNLEFDELIKMPEIKSKVSYLQGFFDNKKKWSKQHLEEHENLSLYTTSRAESMNALIKKYLRPRLGLTELILILTTKDKDNKEMADGELFTNQLINIPFIRRCSAVYSKFCINKLLEFLESSFTMDCKKKNKVSWAVQDKNKERAVNFKKNLYKCECNLYRSWMMPCSHILKVILIQNEKNIATCFFSKRWLLPQENNILADELLLMDLMDQDFTNFLKPTSNEIQDNKPSDTAVTAPHISEEKEIMQTNDQDGKVTPKFTNELINTSNSAKTMSTAAFEESKYS